MFKWIIRVVVVAIGALAGAIWPLPGLETVTGAIAGALLAAAIVFSLALLDRGTPGVLFGGISGFVVAVWLATIFNSLIFGMLSAEQSETWIALQYIVVAAFAFTGVLVGVQRGQWLTVNNIRSMFHRSEERRRYKILDTSVIIDGRISDICETGFVDGTLVVPQFVLRELQYIADSSQTIKRNRGRRGLEILHRIQKQANVKVIIAEKDFVDIPEVDLKLIEMARTMGGKIVTNDFNLNKVAQLRGVEVLNINELANALKPVVLPGEVMQVFVLKVGKEANQGIGYLDDGTMIVVDNANHLVGKNVELVVTSVLQTTAGKMIFGRTEEDGSAPMNSFQQQEFYNGKQVRRA